MSGSTRSFIAVEIDRATADRASAMIDRWRTVGAEVNWVAPKNMHITLKFLGDVRNEVLPEVAQSLSTAVAGIAPFDLEIFGVGAFPNVDRPRTIWLGARQGAKQMNELARAVELKLRPLGFAPEPRGFTTHLTVGRVRRPSAALRSLAEMLRRQAEETCGIVAVEQVILFSSTLTPRGPIYEALSRAPLGAASANAPSDTSELGD